MVRRFLEYSLRYQRPIKAVWLSGDKMATGNITVTGLQEDCFSFTSSRNKKTPRQMPIGDVLSAAYARGDDGDTLKNSRRTEEDKND
ncbi:MAG: hypothetical protein GX540_04160 [Clostridiales bacterium]|nr:hypothetical protein [Clostridiales bacterium]